MIRRATKVDASRISEIHIFAWRSAYRGIVSDDYLYNKISVVEREKDFVERDESTIHEMYVFEEYNIVKGFMKIGPCRNEDKKESFELWGLYVEPGMMNLGIGTQLLNYCEKLAVDRGFKENVIWVFKDNIKTIAFYKKHKYYPDGKIEFMEQFNTNEVRYIKNFEFKS